MFYRPRTARARRFPRSMAPPVPFVDAFTVVALVIVVAAAAGSAGCTQGGARASTPATPVTAATAVTPQERVLAAPPVDHLDTTAREPMLVEHPGGALFVAGYQRENPVVDQPPALWRSDDRGATWQRVDVGVVEEGAAGNSDVDLAVAADGTLYFLTMGFDRSVGQGTHVAVGVSRDVGESWSWTYLSRAAGVDRPWVVLDGEGSAHVIWNDGNGVGYTRSRDHGATWSTPRRIAPRGGSSHLAAGPGNELAARVTPLSASGAQRADDAEWILVSEDGGDNWARHEPPGARVFDGLGVAEGVPRWVEPIAWDAAGALYYLWSEGRELRLGRSVDRGASWETWPIEHADERLFYPYLVARAAGELAASWFSGAGETLAAHVALLRVGADSAPVVLQVPAFQPQSWAPGDPPVRDPAGEYLPVIFSAGGGLAAASPIQDPARQRFGFTYRQWDIR